MTEPNGNYPVFAGYQRVETPDGFLGSGNWGEVLLYESPHGNSFAVKRQQLTPLAEQQRTARKWNNEKLIANESLNGNSNTFPGLAFSFINYDKEGNPHLFIEPVNRFLDDYLGERTLTSAEAIPLMEGMASGLNSLHTRLRRIHGDLYPKNIGYTTDDLVKIIDFGSSTDGTEELQNLGHPLVRAPERFSKDKIRFSSDVWAFGANLYRFFNPQFPFESEHNGSSEAEFATIIQSYYSSSTTWNDIINGKIKRLNTPKAFRELLVKTLCHESERIPNGSRLEDEVERTIRQYGKTLWPYRAKKYVTLFLAAATAIGIGHTAIQQRAEKQGLQLKLAQSQEEKKIEQKVKVIGAYTGGRYNLPQDHMAYMSEGSLAGWLDMFEDTLTGVAAYLDAEPYPLTIAKAIQMANGRKDWASLKEHVRQIDESLYGAMLNLTLGGVDGLCFMINRENRQRVKSKWEEAERIVYGEPAKFYEAPADNTLVKASTLKPPFDVFEAVRKIEKEGENKSMVLPPITRQDIRALKLKPEQDSSRAE